MPIVFFRGNADLLDEKKAWSEDQASHSKVGGACGLIAPVRKAIVITKKLNNNNEVQSRPIPTHPAKFREKPGHHVQITYKTHRDGESGSH